MSIFIQNIAPAAKDGPDVVAWLTAFTAAIALGIPFLLSHLERSRTLRVRKERAHEATSATFNALDVLVDAIEALHERDSDKYASAAARAEGYVGVSEVFVVNPILTDGSIFCLINMKLAMKFLIAGNKKVNSRQWEAVKAELASALALAHPANERGQEVRTNMHIPKRTCGYWPRLPVSIDLPPPARVTPSPAATAPLPSLCQKMEQSLRKLFTKP